MRKYMYKRGCWNEGEEEKWNEDSQKMVCFDVCTFYLDMVNRLGQGSIGY